ncbi:MAG TPA: condensation domain-containing protein, partial [Archangium sp.]
LSRRDFRAPRTDTERTLAAIWAEVLRLDVGKVGLDDDFFSLGGHSLLATQVISRLRSTFQVELPLRALFESPTLEALAARVQSALTLGRTPALPPLLRASREAHLPLSFSQQRLWFLDQMEPGSATYNIPAAFRLSGLLDLPALQHAFLSLSQRHESLRTTFQPGQLGPVQVISTTPSVPMPNVDLQALPESEREAEVRRLVLEEAQTPFDLARGPLLRVRLLTLARDEHVLLLTLHHIVADGWSMGVLIHELATFYEAFTTGRAPRLPELPVQYADYAVWQREWLRGEALEAQLSFWKQQLAGAPAALELPTDKPRPAVQTFEGATHRFQLSRELADALHALCRREGVTPFMALLAAFQVLLSRYSGQDDLCVGSPIAGRRHAELEGLIGFFVNTLVLRTRLDSALSFRELLARVREVTLGAYAHQDVPFEKLVEALRPARAPNRSPLFQVMFVLQNAPLPALLGPGLTLRPLEVEHRSAKFDLTLSLTETPDGFAGLLEYNTDLFEASTAARMMEHLRTLLEGALARPEQPLGALPLLTEAEHRRLVEGDAARAIAGDASLHRLLAAQASRTPDTVALELEGRSLTWREAHTRARS